MAGVCVGTVGAGCSTATQMAAAVIDDEISTAREKQAATVKPPGFGPGWVKMKGDQGYKDPDGNMWKKDMLHKDHWDVSDRKGNKIREVDFGGKQIYPGGPKNKNKKP